MGLRPVIFIVGIESCGIASPPFSGPPVDYSEDLVQLGESAAHVYPRGRQRYSIQYSPIVEEVRKRRDFATLALVS